MAGLGLAEAGYRLPELSSALNIASSVRPVSLGLTPTGAVAATPPQEIPPTNPPMDAAHSTPPAMPQEVPMPDAQPQVDLSNMQPPTPAPVATESYGERAARASKESFYDFTNNPIGSIGRAMASFAAGYRGDPNTPLDKFNAEKIANTKADLEQRAQAYQEAGLQ